MNQEQYRAKLIQLIQINKYDVFSSDEMRKEFMLSRFGQSSTTKLSINQLQLLLSYCKREIRDIEIELVTDKQSQTILKLWKQKGNSEDLIRFCQKFSKRNIDCIKYLSKYEANKIIYVLEKKM